MPRAADVQNMFDRIAGRYDLLNRVMTMGIDKRWRRAAVRAANVGPGTSALDVCCGTGDLTFLLAASGADTIGVDFSANMLERARWRAEGEHVEIRNLVDFIQGDALALPFPDDAFDGLTVGFGVRNVEDLEQAFAEFARVVRPGGRIVCLEITRPRTRVTGAFYHLWFDKVVPIVGGIVSGDREAYSYLPESTLRFPPPDELVALMQRVGIDNVGYRTFAGGIVAVHTGDAPTVARAQGDADVAATPARAAAPA